MNHYDTLKYLHRCIACGHADAFTLSGRSYCADCAEKRREHAADDYRKNKQKYNDRCKAWYYERKKNGLCVKCGKPAETGRTVCKRCSIKRNNAERERNIEKGMNWPRGDNGLCWLCNKKPSMDEYHVCPDCYEIILTAQRAAVKARKESGENELGKRIDEFWKLRKAKQAALS